MYKCMEHFMLLYNFYLLNFELRQQLEEPFKRSLLTIDPEEIDLNL